MASGWNLLVWVPCIECLQVRHGMTSFYFGMAKGACGTTRGMVQQPWSGYNYKLDAKLIARYQEKVSLIKQEDPYALKKTNFCRDTAHLPCLG